MATGHEERRRTAVTTKTDAHERYVELCSLATTGTLSDGEWKALKFHVRQCPECAAAMLEFREIARTAIPLLLPESAPEDCESQDVWSPASAKSDLLVRLARGDASGWADRANLPCQTNAKKKFWSYLQVSNARVALRLAAGFLLIAGLGGGIYRLGMRQERALSHGPAFNSLASSTAFRNQLGDIEHEKTVLEISLEAKSTEIQALSKRLDLASAEMARLQTLEKRSNQDLNQQSSQLTEAVMQRNATVVERDVIARKLEETEKTATALRLSLDRLRQERTSELLHTASLEARIADLTARAQRPEEVHPDDAQQLLASDRDIRELMGARELYIADVFDVDPNSRTEKPFGRVFYTHGKSLIFYAFDLDKQRGVKNASTYQAWGKRGPHDPRPFSMGIFYLDSDANRRWVLKFDDAEALARIDSVFVTVEPKGGSREPRGKALLMASLKSQPNHP